jgi:hypothetical protein
MQAARRKTSGIGENICILLQDRLHTSLYWCRFFWLLLQQLNFHKSMHAVGIKLTMKDYLAASLLDR